MSRSRATEVKKKKAHVKVEQERVKDNKTDQKTLCCVLALLFSRFSSR